VNYLAHAYLSFGIPEITVGNLISDFIKGKKKFDYPPAIQRGIALHRSIDTFTDAHAITRRAKGVFRPVYGLYAGALVDVAYDHFLANDPGTFGAGGAAAAPGAGPDPGVGLKAFAQKTYEQVGAWQAFFPERFARMFPYMRAQDWLYNYRYREGIFNSFAGLARRAAYMPEPAAACRLFEEQYEELEACYQEFFPLLKDFAFETLGGL
jgi:acyl carrier protein phosphodiesterase